MMSVEHIIGDLLVQHNCVIVPTFGGFVAQRVSASFDVIEGMAFPPRKALLFNRQLINNDGLLTTTYARANKCSYDEALETVRATIIQWETELKAGHRITIDRVGFLYFDQEQNLCFEQDRFFNLLLESFGLGVVRFIGAGDISASQQREEVQKVVEHIEKTEVKATEIEVVVPQTDEPLVEFEPEQVAPIIQPSFVFSEKPSNEETIQLPPIFELREAEPWSRRKKYTFAAALAPLAFYVFWIPMQTDVLESGVLSIRDFNPFRSVPEGTYQPSNEDYVPIKRRVKSQLKDVPPGATAFPLSIDDMGYIPVRIDGNSTKVVQRQVVNELAPAVSKDVLEPRSMEKKPSAVSIEREVAQTNLARPNTEKKSEKKDDLKSEVPTEQKVAKRSYIIVGSFSNEANAQDVIQQLRAKGIEPEILAAPNGGVRVSAGDGKQFKSLNGQLQGMGLAPWVMK